MEDEQHLFQIPVEDIFHLYHGTTTVDDEYIVKVLTEANGLDADRPIPARIEASLNNDPGVALWFHPDPRLPQNPRARQVMSDIFGWHMVFHGAVVVLGLTSEQVTTVIRDYG